MQGKTGLPAGDLLTTLDLTSANTPLYATWFKSTTMLVVIENALLFLNNYKFLRAIKGIVT